MSNEKRQEKALDAALDGSTPDEETQPLVDTAARVKQTLAVDVPPADRQRALFLSGVAARERTRFSPLRVLVPALAIAIVILTGFVGQTALPGQGLYPVREAMNSVGIGTSPVAEVDDHCKEALALIRRAEASIDTDPEEATALAVLAIEELGPARRLLPELNGQREDWIEWVEDLEEDAVEIITEAAEEQQESADDNSGPGSDGSGSENSGSGSDNSGSGSGNSGSGSDDAGDDNSGSGSDDSGDDNSGSGSDDSGSGGSGSDDSSGSGSGSYDSSGSG
jgi:uncharacterized membrane protein YgcG